MIALQGHKNFWDKNAGRYDRFMRKDRAAYDEMHIRQLLEKYDLVPNRGISLAAATVRGLILTVSHKEQIGELYPQVLETLVYGACRELFE